MIKVSCETCKGSGCSFCEGWHGESWHKIVRCLECKGEGHTLKDLYELDIDQGLPENPHVDIEAKERNWPDSPYEEVYSQSQQDMIKAGWRKVKNAKE